MLFLQFQRQRSDYSIRAGKKESNLGMRSAFPERTKPSNVLNEDPNRQVDIGHSRKTMQ